MKFPNTLLVLPLLLAPLACSKAEDAAAAAKDGVANAGGAVMDALPEVDLDSIGDFSEDAKEKLVGGLEGFMPSIDGAVSSLKEKAESMTGGLPEAMQEKLESLSGIQTEIPEMVSKLKDGGAEAFTSLLPRAKELMTQLPEMLKGLTGN